MAAALSGEKKHAQAVAVLERFLAEFPDHPRSLRARLLLGESLLAQDRPADAARALDALLSRQPAPEVRAEALLTLGRARLALKDETRAREAWAEAFALTEYDETLGPTAGMLLGEALLRERKYAEAAHAFERVTRWHLHPDAPRAQFRAGESYLLAGSQADAALAFRQTAEKYWRHALAPRAALAAGNLLLALHRLPEAEAEYRRVVQTHPESPEAPRAQLGLGQVALDQRQFSTARAAFEAAGLLYGRAGIAPEAALRVADTYLAEGRPADAERGYAALTGNANRQTALAARYGLGLARRAAGRTAEALEAFRGLASEAAAGRWSQLAALRVAESQSAAGDAAGAAAGLRALLRAEPEPPIRQEASLLLAEALLRRQDVPGAEAALGSLPAAGLPAELAPRVGPLRARARLEAGDAAAAAASAETLLRAGAAGDLRAELLTVQGRARLRLKEDVPGTAALREVVDRHAGSPAAAEAAEALLVHYRAAGQDTAAREIEAFLSARFGGGREAVEASLREAESRLRAGKPGEARTLYARALAGRLDPESRRRALAGLAEAAAAAGDPAAAAEPLRALEQEGAGGPLGAARLAVARAHARAGDTTQAAAAYRALLAAPDAATTPAALLELAGLLGERSPEAVALLRRLTAEYPRAPAAPGALYALAWAEREAGRAEEAAQLFSRLAREHPGHPLAADACFRLGEADDGAGRLEAAAGWYRKALAAAELPAPAAEAAGYRLGWALLRLEKHDEAARAFLAAAERFPRGDYAAECRLRAGEELLRAGEPQAALEPLRAVIDASPGAVGPAPSTADQARAAAAAAHLELGEAAAARRLAAAAARPENGRTGARAELLVAEATRRLDGPAAAAKAFERAAVRAAAFRDLAAEARFRAGECHLAARNAAGARAAWRRLLELYPDTPWAARGRERLNALPPTSR